MSPFTVTSNVVEIVVAAMVLPVALLAT